MKCRVLLVGIFVGCMMENLCLAQTLGQALDATNLTWTTSGTGGGSGWSVETTRTHDSVSAARSGALYVASQTSVVQTTVTGPGTLSFWWSDASSYNRLSFSGGGAALASIVAYPSWQQQTIYLGPGTQVLQWVYSFSAADSANSGYLDQVSYIPGATAPVIISQPLSQSQVPGFSTSFSAVARGTPPLSWQWHFEGMDVPDATNSSLTITNVQSVNVGNYSVTVSNSVGSMLSSNASLEFGQLTAWGENGFDATMTPPGATNLLAVAAGVDFSLALKADGTLLAWGNDTQGEVSGAANISNAVAIAARESSCLALEADGTVLAWGNNSTNMPPGISNAVAIAAGMFLDMALTRDGSVLTWGNLNSTNQPAGLTNVVGIAAGASGSVGLRADGSLLAWGPGPALPANLSNVVAIAAGGAHYMALRDDGTVTCWGDNTYGQSTPPLGLSNVVAISAGELYSAALLANGTVTAWGTSIAGVTNPPVGLTNVDFLAAGYLHSVAVVGSAPPVLAALIKNPQLSSSGFNVVIPSQSGRVYALEYKNALEENVWTPLPLVAGTGKELVLRDPAAGLRARFYRVRRW